MFKMFKSKKQADAVKAVPVDTATMAISKSLTLSDIRIIYDINRVEPFYANITYTEKPKEWRTSEQGASETVEIKGTTWSELLDNVDKHFKETV